MKHLEKQKRGKAKLKSLGAGNIHVPQTAFFEVLSNKASK
jgi:translation elongation factor EF-4